MLANTEEEIALHYHAYATKYGVPKHITNGGPKKEKRIERNKSQQHLKGKSLLNIHAYISEIKISEL